MKQSKKLTQFYRDYLKWVEAGAPTDHHCFSRKHGLCANLTSTCKSLEDIEVLLDELLTQFEAAKFSSVFPFGGSMSAYMEDLKNQTHHLNPERIKWVRDHINA